MSFVSQTAAKPVKRVAKKPLAKAKAVSEKERWSMSAVKVWTVLTGAALTLAVGACSAGAKTAAHATSPPAVSTPALSTPAVSTPDVPTTQPAGGTTPTTRLTAASAAQLILGINEKIQQAQNTPNGLRALTREEVQAIVEAQTKQLGLPVPKP